MLTILLILTSLINPVWANNTIVIKRKQAKNKALLDYKFVFMQEQTAFKASPQTEKRRSQISYPATTKLTEAFTHPQKLTPEIIVHKQHTKTIPSKAVNIYNEDNWNDFAIESNLDEHLGVQAWIIKE
ncbi:MAG: hypothetical protein O3C63_01080 [Cyanobacteria bacterium]|nr:hypothetical protein [Cyanobacteriota bacterium]MDA1021033.1 hypothetical protein [Cyanobacteriota bacterium]